MTITSFSDHLFVVSWTWAAVSGMIGFAASYWFDDDRWLLPVLQEPLVASLRWALTCGLTSVEIGEEMNQPVVRPEFDRLAIDRIQVDRPDRQRSALDIGSLKASIARNGLINPIIVGYRPDGDGIWLIAGERRLESCRELGWSVIPVRYLAELSPIERQIIELEENIKRLDLPWQDIVRAVGPRAWAL